MNRFDIDPGDYFIWNKNELLDFLIANQGQDITIGQNREGCCYRAVGLYDLLDKFQFNSVHLETDNLAETHESYTIAKQNPVNRFFVLHGDIDYTQYHYWNKQKVFGALFNKPQWHRVGLAGHLTEFHNDITLLNFRSNPHIADERKMYDLQKLFDIDPKSAEYFLKHRNTFPKTIEETDGYVLYANPRIEVDSLSSFYPNFLIDIVSETFVEGRTFFPTEKTLRPMLLKKPFIVMGPKCFLIHLRQLGFKTFFEFWDESYDGLKPNDKYKQILNLIDSLSKRSALELEIMYNKMQDILEHNYELCKSRTFKRAINYIE